MASQPGTTPKTPKTATKTSIYRQPAPHIPIKLLLYTKLSEFDHWFEGENFSPARLKIFSLRYTYLNLKFLVLSCLAHIRVVRTSYLPLPSSQNP